MTEQQQLSPQVRPIIDELCRTMNWQLSEEGKVAYVRVSEIVNRFVAARMQANDQGMVYRCAKLQECSDLLDAIEDLVQTKKQELARITADAIREEELGIGPEIPDDDKRWLIAKWPDFCDEVIKATSRPAA